ncbi:MAG: carbamoyl phosphate synthase small subunit [Candidatus Acidiferrales bacterium]
MEDGRVFKGRAAGARTRHGGEVVFNTSLTGYQEVFSDPSYAGQIVCLTYPHIGNVGANLDDEESAKPYIEALVVREFSQLASNWRSSETAQHYLERNGVPVIWDIDTRALVRHLRNVGALRGIVATDGTPAEQLIAEARSLPTMAGQELASRVTSAKTYEWTKSSIDLAAPLAASTAGSASIADNSTLEQPRPRPRAGIEDAGGAGSASGSHSSKKQTARALRAEGPSAEGRLGREANVEGWSGGRSYGSDDPPIAKNGALAPEAIPRRRVVAYDFGIKQNILRLLVDHNCEVTVVPAQTSAEDVLALKPQGVFLSNGPGDPEPLNYAVENIRKLLGRVPLFGICLGHQLCGLALGGRTFKLKFGHHGSNHPVKNLLTQKVEITSQNHGFCVDPDSLPASEVEITHVNLNDQTNEGMRHRSLPLFSVQYHPEAAPGPHDARYLFHDFVTLMNKAK